MKEAMGEMIKSLHLESKMNQVKLINAWPKIMGTTVNLRTKEILIADRKLFVTLLSASLRQELFQERQKIIQKLNEEAGASVIDEIIFR